MSFENLIMTALDRAASFLLATPATGTLPLPQTHSDGVMPIKLYFTLLLLVCCGGYLVRAYRELVTRQDNHEKLVTAHLSSCTKPDKRILDETEKRLDKLELKSDKMGAMTSQEWDRKYDRYYLDESIPVDEIPGGNPPTRGGRR